jgi:hypothetical protein
VAFSHSSQERLEWATQFSKKRENFVLILKTKDLKNLDPVNKGLTGLIL